MTDEGRRGAARGRGEAGRSVRDLRRANRAMLLRHLYFHGPLSRQELIQATGLSSASVSNVVADLLEAGVVEEAGAVESEGGRPRILLRVAAERFHAVGIDVGETRVRVERFDLAMREIARADIAMAGGRLDPGAVTRAVADGLAAVTADHPAGAAAGARAAAGAAAAGAPAPTRAAPAPVLLGAGVGVPGIVQRDPEAIVHGQTIGWDAVPIEAMIRAAAPGFADLPLHVDNGATTMGQAETWFGAGRGSANAVLLLIGSGVGASVLTGGVPFRGFTTSAGEWGHTNAVLDGRSCRCGARGCLEAYISAESVIARWQEAASADGDRPELPDADEESALHAIVDLAAAPDGTPGAGAARGVLDRTAVHLGVGIAALVNLFNPERVLIGGWAGLMMGRRLLPRIREVARGHALRLPFAQTSLELCALGPDAVALGAATLPVARFLDSGGERPPRAAAPVPPARTTA